MNLQELQQKSITRNQHERENIIRLGIVSLTSEIGYLVDVQEAYGDTMPCHKEIDRIIEIKIGFMLRTLALIAYYYNIDLSEAAITSFKLEKELQTYVTKGIKNETISN